MRRSLQSYRSRAALLHARRCLILAMRAADVDHAANATVQIASAATQARDAAVEAEKQRVAEKQASRDRLTAEAGPRRASSRTAAARTATKLRQQARSGRSGDDGASSSDEGSADRQQHGGQRGRMAAGEYDPLGALPLPPASLCILNLLSFRPAACSLKYLPMVVQVTMRC